MGDSQLERARNVFGADHFAALTGVTIEQVGDHEAVCTLSVEERHRNARGVVMGGVLFTVADFCAAVAANSTLLTQQSPLAWVSLDSTIHFLAPGTGNQLVATCSALKLGRTTSLYQTKIESPDQGKQIALVETTMIHV